MHSKRLKNIVMEQEFMFAGQQVNQNTNTSIYYIAAMHGNVWH